MTYQIDLEARTVHGTEKGDGIHWRGYGLLWSRRQTCWVWARTVTAQRIERACYQMRTDGLDIETVGETAPIVRDRDADDLASAERHERKAATATAEAERRLAAGHATLDQIPLGQPIITGRGSRTTADINRRQRARDNMGKGFDAMTEAENHERLAAEARARVAHRSTLRALPVPPEMIEVGDVIERRTATRRSRYTVAKVNRTTIRWEMHGCSSTIKHGELFELHRDGVQLWPVV